MTQVVPLLFALACLLHSAHAQSAVQHIKAQPQNGFHQDYLLLVPERLRTNSVFLIATPTPKTSEDPTELRAAADRVVRNAQPLLEQLGLPILVPILPRPPLKLANDHYIDVYFPALSRDALQATEEKFRRIDLQVLSMIVDARATLQQSRGVNVSPRSIFIGFSAAGHFATRMAILHPERVLAVWAGGMGGHPIVPMAEWNGKPLTYPVGNSDLLDLIGHKFQHEHFRGLNVMLVQGDADTNTSLPSDPKPSDSYTFEQAELIRAFLGNDSVQRLSTATSIWEKAGAKVQMKVYPDAGHQITPEIARDMIAFLEACRPNSK